MTKLSVRYVFSFGAPTLIEIVDILLILSRFGGNIIHFKVVVEKIEFVRKEIDYEYFDTKN